MLLFLAALIRRSSPEPAARGPLALFMALVGANYTLDHATVLLGAAGVVTFALQHLALIAVLLDGPVLLYFALQLTQPHVSRRVGLAVAAPGAALAVLYILMPPDRPYFEFWAFGPLQPVELAVYYVLAFALVVRAYLDETRPLARDRLASLVLAVGVVVLGRLPLLGVDAGVYRTDDVATLLVGLAVTAGLAGLLVWPFVTPANRRHVHRTQRQLLALLALVAGVWMLLLVPGLDAAVVPLVYSVRWFLFALVLAEGIEHFDLLNLPRRWERRARRALYATLILLAIAQVSAVLAGIPDTNLRTSLIGGISTVGIGASVYAAVSRPTRQRRPELEWRRTAVYRTYLELGVDAEELASIRERLGITEAEAAEVDALAELERRLPRDEHTVELNEGGIVHGRYEVQGFLGMGTFGRTFVAWDAARRERVVLKEVRVDREADRVALDHAHRDAETMMAVDHPNVVGFRGLERFGGGYLLVLDYVEGEDLREHLAGGPLSTDAVHRVAQDLLAGLAALHAAGIIHRDVKPENVMLRPDGRAVLLDFGTASRLGRSARTGTVRAHAVAPAGTPAYMAPEQRAGEDLTPACDVYACGAVLWELLTGKPAGHGEPPAAWRDVLERALAEEPSARWPNAQAMGAALPAPEAR